LKNENINIFLSQSQFRQERIFTKIFQNRQNVINSTQNSFFSYLDFFMGEQNIFPASERDLTLISQIKPSFWRYLAEQQNIFSIFVHI